MPLQDAVNPMDPNVSWLICRRAWRVALAIVLLRHSQPAHASILVFREALHAIPNATSSPADCDLRIEKMLRSCNCIIYAYPSTAFAICCPSRSSPLLCCAYLLPHLRIHRHAYLSPSNPAPLLHVLALYDARDRQSIAPTLRALLVSSRRFCLSPRPTCQSPMR